MSQNDYLNKVGEMLNQIKPITESLMNDLDAADMPEELKGQYKAHMKDIRSASQSQDMSKIMNTINNLKKWQTSL